jgi:hypothetical protein
MNDITYRIQQQTYKAEKQTNDWLKDNGLNVENFFDIELHLVQAQMIANNILKHHAHLLGQNEAHSLNNFLLAMRNRKKRSKLKIASAYKVMNIGNAVNRKLFKEHKRTK